MKEKYSFINNLENINLKLHINKRFDNVFDLAYTLVDLQSVLSTFYYVTFTEYKAKSLQTTNRNFTKQFSDVLKLKSFQSGTFTGDIGSSILSGLVLKFIEKAIDNNSKQQRNPNITINFNAPMTVNVYNFNGNSSDFDRKVDEIIAHTEVIPGDIERSIKNFLDKLKTSGIIEPHHFVYTDEGIKEFANSLSRLGRNFDIRI